MATTIYKNGYVTLMDGTELIITPLKIKYLREFMDRFEYIKTDESMTLDEALLSCVLIAMKQYYPQIKTIDDLEDSIDLPTMYKILDYSAGIKINAPEEDSGNSVDMEDNSSWDKLDLAKMESEAFLIGIWKDYLELEESLSMPELIATLESKREMQKSEQKFLAAIQGIDIDGGSSDENAWEKLKARVSSRNQTDNPNDILSFQGVKAAQAGFGIGMGLEYSTSF